MPPAASSTPSAKNLYARLLALDSLLQRERPGYSLPFFFQRPDQRPDAGRHSYPQRHQHGVVYIAALYLMTAFSPLTALGRPCPFSLMIIIVKRLTASMFRAARSGSEDWPSFQPRGENVSAAALVRAYCRGERPRSRRSRSDAELLGRIWGWPSSGMDSRSCLPGALAPSSSSSRRKQGDRGTFTLGDFVAFQRYLAMLIWPTISWGGSSLISGERPMSA